MAEKKLALTFTLGGAPNTPHVVDGLPGYFQTGKVTPVGGVGEPSEEQAKACDKDPGCDVKLTTVSPGDLEKAREWQQEVRQLAAGAVAKAARSGDGGTVARAVNESAAGGKE